MKALPRQIQTTFDVELQYSGKGDFTQWMRRSMLNLRLTSKLSKRFRITPGVSDQPSTTVLGDWYANLIYVGRAQYVIYMAEKSFLPIIIPAKDIKIETAMLNNLKAMLSVIGVPSPLIQPEIEEMKQVTFCKTNSKVVLGMMNDFSRALSYRQRDESLRVTSLWIAKTPCSPHKGSNPIDVTLGLFGQTYSYKEIDARVDGFLKTQSANVG